MDDSTLDNTFDVIALGEAIVDFTQAGISENGQVLYERNPGGAPANMVTMCAALGLKCAFIGCVGADIQGDFLRDTLADAGVDVSRLSSTSATFTTMSFVQVDPASGERSFDFARKPGADMDLHVDESTLKCIHDSRLLHVGSLTLTDYSSRLATLSAVLSAKDAKTLVSFDPNWRPALWNDGNFALSKIDQVIRNSDLMKASLDEAEFLSCNDDSYQDAIHSATTSNISIVTRAVIAGSALLHRDAGPALVAITLGDEGAFIATNNASAFVAAYKPAALVDTTGAGDIFWGAFVGWLLNEAQVRTRADLNALDAATLTKAGDFACAAASLSIEKHGGIPSTPTLADITNRITTGTRL